MHPSSTTQGNDRVDLKWLRKYSTPGPRYTSYPTAPVFSNDFGPEDYGKLLSANGPGVPLSFYYHIPFCKSVCAFCACSVVYTRKTDRVDPYLDMVIQEMDMVRSHIHPGRTVTQLHWGGGSPTFLTPDRMESFMKAITRRFSIQEDAEVSIELDPRESSTEHLEVLRELGFNRASLGIQDVDEAVQKAVNRIQPLEEVILPVYETLNRLGFSGVNVDLIYGLPHQTPGSFARTLNAVLDMRPARISLFNFAYLPHLKTHQKRIKEADLPGTEDRLEIFASAVHAFVSAGYEYIGMDHFALPEDELSVSQKKGELHRNFQGYTTRGGSDLIGFGVTSIGEIANGYAQNTKDLNTYMSSIAEGKLPIERGLIRSKDDTIRHSVIMQLINHFELDFHQVEDRFQIDFPSYFQKELQGLVGFQNDGLLTVDQNGIRVFWQGRFVIRNICMVFDAHLTELQKKGQKFSKTV